MSQEKVEALMDRWINDRDFRAGVQEDLQCALIEIGAELTATELSTVMRLFTTLAVACREPTMLHHTSACTPRRGAAPER